MSPTHRSDPAGGAPLGAAFRLGRFPAWATAVDISHD